MKRTIFGFLAAACALGLTVWVSPASAEAGSPDPGALAAARQLTDLVVATGFQDAMAKQGWPSVEAAIRKGAPSVTDQQIAALRGEFTSAVSDEVTVAMKDVPAIYIKYFTAAELKDILAFYETPTGRKALATLPLISGESMRLVMTRMPDMQVRLKERFARVLEAQGLVPGKP